MKGEMHNIVFAAINIENEERIAQGGKQHSIEPRKIMNLLVFFEFDILMILFNWRDWNLSRWLNLSQGGENLEI
jgi:hypothetical protein